MDKRLHCVLLWCFLILYFYTQIEAQTGVCEKDPLICCQNYRGVGGKCVECWPGFFGYNCTNTCPEGFYGKFCRGKCNCSQCDKVSGCKQNSSSQGTAIPGTGYLGRQTSSRNASSSAFSILIGVKGKLPTLDISLKIIFLFLMHTAFGDKF